MINNFINWAGGLDLLVNNASSFYPTPVGTITDNQWHDLMGTNLKGPLFITQAATNALKEAKGLSLIHI